MMKLLRAVASIVSIVVLAGVMTGCGGASSSGGGSNVRGITSASDASFVIQDMADGVLGNNLFNGLTANTSPSGQVVPGSIGGSASVTGTYDYSPSVSCGASCTTSQWNVSLTIVFNDYTVMTASNTKTTVNGTVTYTSDLWSEQNGTNYSFGGTETINGSSVHYRVVDVNGYWGYDDTITFGVSGPSTSGLSGQCTSGSGTFTL